jgi:hypothetical protein
MPTTIIARVVVRSTMASGNSWFDDEAPRSRHDLATSTRLGRDKPPRPSFDAPAAGT